jgi:hypothetical protein
MPGAFQGTESDSMALGPSMDAGTTCVRAFAASWFALMKLASASVPFSEPSGVWVNVYGDGATRIVAGHWSFVIGKRPMTNDQ